MSVAKFHSPHSLSSYLDSFYSTIDPKQLKGGHIIVATLPQLRHESPVLTELTVHPQDEEYWPISVSKS